MINPDYLRRQHILETILPDLCQHVALYPPVDPDHYKAFLGVMAHRQTFAYQIDPVIAG